MQKMEEIFLSLARPSMRQVKPYDAKTIDEPKIRLSANESSFGAPLSVINAMEKALTGGNRYPDGCSGALRRKLAARFSLDPGQIITSNGLDGLFTMLGRAFICDGDEVVCGECTFGVYESTALIAGASVKKVTLGEGFAQRPDDFAAAVGPKTKMLFFCNPNNPTGTFSEAPEVRGMLEKIPESTIVVLDEAYFEFTGEDEAASFSLLEDFPNLIICRTFSKLFALAGLRVGWAAAHPDMLGCLYRVREPYCVTSIAEAGACAALDDRDFFMDVRRAVAEEREKLCGALQACGVRFVPSRANFILLLPEDGYERIYSAFAENGIAVRSLILRGERVIRLSIGTPGENARAAQAVAEATGLRRAQKAQQ